MASCLSRFNNCHYPSHYRLLFRSKADYWRGI